MEDGTKPFPMVERPNIGIGGSNAAEPAPPQHGIQPPTAEFATQQPEPLTSLPETGKMQQNPDVAEALRNATAGLCEQLQAMRQDMGQLASDVSRVAGDVEKLKQTPTPQPYDCPPVDTEALEHRLQSFISGHVEPTQQMLLEKMEEQIQNQTCHFNKLEKDIREQLQTNTDQVQEARTAVQAVVAEKAAAVHSVPMEQFKPAETAKAVPPLPAPTSPPVETAQTLGAGVGLIKPASPHKIVGMQDAAVRHASASTKSTAPAVKKPEDCFKKLDGRQDSSQALAPAREDSFIGSQDETESLEPEDAEIAQQPSDEPPCTKKEKTAKKRWFSCGKSAEAKAKKAEQARAKDEEEKRKTELAQRALAGGLAGFLQRCQPGVYDSHTAGLPPTQTLPQLPSFSTAANTLPEIAAAPPASVGGGLPVASSRTALDFVHQPYGRSKNQEDYEIRQWNGGDAECSGLVSESNGRNASANDGNEVQQFNLSTLSPRSEHNSDSPAPARNDRVIGFGDTREHVVETLGQSATQRPFKRPTVETNFHSATQVQDLTIGSMSDDGLLVDSFNS